MKQSYPLTPAQQVEVKRLYAPVQQAREKLEQEAEVFNGFMSYLKAEHNIPSDKPYVFSPDFAEFMLHPQYVEAEAKKAEQAKAQEQQVEDQRGHCADPGDVTGS